MTDWPSASKGGAFLLSERGHWRHSGSPGSARTITDRICRDVTASDAATHVTATPVGNPARELRSELCGRQSDRIDEERRQRICRDQSFLHRRGGHYRSTIAIGREIDIAVRMPARIAVGLGGQPGTATSTGITFDTRPRLA